MMLLVSWRVRVPAAVAALLLQDPAKKTDPEQSPGHLSSQLDDPEQSQRHHHLPTLPEDEEAFCTSR